jgi:hypothetical protein
MVVVGGMYDAEKAMTNARGNEVGSWSLQLLGTYSREKLCVIVGG